jgi:uncharacterized protein YqfA (UPF0365 family)
MGKEKPLAYSIALRTTRAFMTVLPSSDIAAMPACVQEIRSKVTEAEAQVPLAIAEAFRSGKLGVMDYVKYNNVNADTEMRQSIAKGGTGEGRETKLDDGYKK